MQEDVKIIFFKVLYLLAIGAITFLVYFLVELGKVKLENWRNKKDAKS